MIRVEKQTGGPTGENNVEINWLTDAEAPVVWNNRELVVKPESHLHATRQEGTDDLVIEGAVYSS
jgi:hypothetical protein